MIKLRLLNRFLLAISVISVSCSQKDVSFPEPATIIEGKYTAETFLSKAGVTALYPIQGQTMTLELTSVSRDSIRVELEATPNGDYSPGGNRNHEKLFIIQEFDIDIINKKQETCIAYKVHLPIVPTVTTQDELLRIRCPGGAIDYYFTPPNSQNQVMVRFVKI